MWCESRESLQDLGVDAKGFYPHYGSSVAFLPSCAKAGQRFCFGAVCTIFSASDLKSGEDESREQVSCVGFAHVLWSCLQLF